MLGAAKDEGSEAVRMLAHVISRVRRGRTSENREFRTVDHDVLSAPARRSDPSATG